MMVVWWGSGFCFYQVGCADIDQKGLAFASGPIFLIILNVEKSIDQIATANTAVSRTNPLLYLPVYASEALLTGTLELSRVGASFDHRGRGQFTDNVDG